MVRWVMAVASLFALWFGGWFALAWWADGRVAEALETARGDGLAIDCSGREIIGFPFRLGIRCNTLDLASRDAAMMASSGTLRGQALIYRPDEILTEIDAPMSIRTAHDEITATWSNLQVYSDVEFGGGFDRISINARDVRIKASAGGIDAESMALHTRPRPVDETEGASLTDDLDIAASAHKSSITGSGGFSLPDVSFAFDATLVDGYQDLVTMRLPLRDILEAGGRLVIRRLALEPASGGRIVLEGELDLDAAGLLSGALRIGLAEPDKLTAWVESLHPSLRQPVAMLTQSVTGMGQAGTVAGYENLRSIQLQLTRGELRLGFIKIADIPPLTP